MMYVMCVCVCVLCVMYGVCVMYVRVFGDLCETMGWREVRYK